MVETNETCKPETVNQHMEREEKDAVKEIRVCY